MGRQIFVREVRIVDLLNLTSRTENKSPGTVAAASGEDTVPDTADTTAEAPPVAPFTAILLVVKSLLET